MSDRQAEAFRNTIHEKLHFQAEGGMAYARMTPAQRSIEEGSTEATTQDIAPAIAWRMWRVRLPDTGHPYGACTTLIRKWSARYTRTFDWHSRAARTARIAFHTAAYPRRDELLRSVGLVPGCDITD